MKKKYLYIYTLALIFLSLSQACKKEEIIKAPVATLTETVLRAPENNTLINLNNKTDGLIVTFEWDAVKASDGNIVFYSLLLDKENGDFSNPLYIGTPAKLGSETLFSISHLDLNRVAKAAGIQELQTGKLKWKVVPSTGVYSSDKTESRVLELKRPIGLTESPENVYLYGEATEAGTDITKAIPFKKTATGKFEVYTSLKAGTYKMIDKLTGTPISFILTGARWSELTEAAEGISPVTTPTVYRINLDFTKNVAVLTEIQSIGLWFSGYNTIKYNLTYEGSGEWKAADVAIVWAPQGSSKDERYKFRASEKDTNSVVSLKFWGGPNSDNGTRPTATTPITYYKLNTVNNSQWDYTYKFEKEAAKADIIVKFKATGDYTHSIIYK